MLDRTEPRIVEDYPELTVEDIRACLAFAAQREHRLTAAYGGLRQRGIKA